MSKTATEPVLKTSVSLCNIGVDNRIDPRVIYGVLDAINDTSEVNIVPYPGLRNPRTTFTNVEDEVAAQGHILQPIIVTEHPDHPGQVIIVDGHSRMRGVVKHFHNDPNSINFAKIPCIWVKFDNTTQLNTNMLKYGLKGTRHDLSDKDIANHIQFMFDNGATFDDIRKSIMRTGRALHHYITKYTKILFASPLVKSAFQSDQIDHECLKACVNHGANTGEDVNTPENYLLQDEKLTEILNALATKSAKDSTKDVLKKARKAAGGGKQRGTITFPAVMEALKNNWEDYNKTLQYFADRKDTAPDFAPDITNMSKQDIVEHAYKVGFLREMQMYFKVLKQEDKSLRECQEYFFSNLGPKETGYDKFDFDTNKDLGDASVILY